MSAEIHVGDVGTSFRLTVKDEDGAVIDLSTALVLQIWFRRPDGAVLTKDAQLVNAGSDGLMEYVTAVGDLSSPGKWKFQGYVELTSSDVVHTDITEFKVFANLQ